ncbi:SDR family NAD(P)-dependent oxidoreductase [Rhizobium lusitanum]|uniref:SDR family NAD(P)-dependent oxidoreductase n=1 Tax=Rhizobium lusitanum TaxID=293958 RepID=UPI001FEE53E8|nr:SDR family NAD(P)-dependent oxidoreductase [Rhizobium lusitanum]
MQGASRLKGANLVIPRRNQSKLDRAASQIRTAAASSVVRTVLVEVGTADGAAELIRQVADVDTLINNLGIYESRTFTEITDDMWRRNFETNVLSGARLARRYLPGMLARDWGRGDLHLE